MLPCGSLHLAAAPEQIGHGVRERPSAGPTDPRPAVTGDRVKARTTRRVRSMRHSIMTRSNRQALAFGAVVLLALCPGCRKRDRPAVPPGVDVLPVPEAREENG